jgi:uroporphyrinogen decarboxylase
MNSRQRVLTAMRHQLPDRVPVDLSWGLTPALLSQFQRITGADSPDDYFDLDVRFVSPELSKGWGTTPGVDDEGHLDPEQHIKEAAFREYFDQLSPDTSLTEWGVGHQRGSTHHFVKFLHPLGHAISPKDVEDFPFPTFNEAWRWERLKADINIYHQRDLCVAGMAAATIFETAWQLRGYNNLLEDFILNPDLADSLLNKITDIRCSVVKRLVRYGVDVLVLGDDIAQQNGMMISPLMWRMWLRTRLTQVIEAARGVRHDVLILYHCDGDLRAIIPDLIEIGVDILNPVQPECMDPESLKAEFGDHLSFWGTIGTQTTFPFGTTDGIKQEVRKRVETVGQGGGLLLGPTHMLEPEIPFENILAFFEAVHEYGVYS